MKKERFIIIIFVRKFFFIKLVHLNSDYGLAQFREEDAPLKGEKEQLHNNKALLSKIYLAPETELLKPNAMTPAADVYSFAIVLVEIATRNEPNGVS